jgi:hypothetical protein
MTRSQLSMVTFARQCAAGANHVKPQRHWLEFAANDEATA